jgi:hypothetical protein
MAANTPPLTIGTASARAELKKDLGKVYWLEGKAYRLVKAGAAIAAAAKKVVVGALSAGAFTWAVDVTTTANLHTVLGIIPAGQTGSTGLSGLVSGDYFMLQCSGCTDTISAAAIADGGLIGTSTTAGKVDDASAAAGVGAFGVALEAAAAGDEATGIYIKGLV